VKREILQGVSDSSEQAIDRTESGELFHTEAAS